MARFVSKNLYNNNNNNYYFISVTQYIVHKKPTPAYESHLIMYYLLIMARRSINILYTAQETALITFE